jgi:DUF1680 family protein
MRSNPAHGIQSRSWQRVHANTHLPQLLGVMARYEATGDMGLRRAVESFWAELSEQHTFATGGSTAGEVWLRGSVLGDAASHQHAENYWAHDHAETCVAHNSMRVARRLLQWGGHVRPPPIRIPPIHAPDAHTHIMHTHTHNAHTQSIP